MLNIPQLYLWIQVCQTVHALHDSDLMEMILKM